MKPLKVKTNSSAKIIAYMGQLVCFLFLALDGVSCERRSHFVFWNDSDHFCDGKTFSLLVEKEDGVQVVQFMEHGSGYRAASKSDSWLVQWKIAALKGGQTNYPANVISLGRHEVIQKRDKPLPVRESGADLSSFRTSGETDYVLREAQRLEVFRVVGQTRGQLTGSNFHWDYRNRRAFVSNSKIDLDMARREVVVVENDYEQRQTKRFVLNAGEKQDRKSVV